MIEGEKLLGLYREAVQEKDNLSFAALRSTAVSLLRDHFSTSEMDELFLRLNRGRSILQQEAELLRYLYSFGNKHQRKMQIALSKIPELPAIASEEYSVVDWGCGQGLATICLLDFLRKSDCTNLPKKTILIEPSDLALDNAAFHAGLYGIEDPITVNKLLDDVDEQDIETDTPTTIHLFSNILDVEGFDIKHLAETLGASAQGTHYLICVSPIYANSKRMEAFKGYFFDTEDLSYERESQNNLEIIAEETLEEKTPCSFTMELLIFKFIVGKSSVIKTRSYPPVQFFAAYELDSIRSRRHLLPEAANANWQSRVAFELLAPFELGASAYENVHPVLATINNIITRGLPTKCSPFIEEAFACRGNALLPDNLGSIEYDGAVSNEETVRLEQIYSPIGAARIQKTLIEAIISGKLSMEQKCWHVLTCERDVPCAAIAIKDLRDMFAHIAALSQAYQDYKLPEIELSIISNETWGDSPLHLGLNTSTSITPNANNTPYDIVIDVSLLEHIENEEPCFNEFPCKNDCYFIIKSAEEIRSSRKIYTAETIAYQKLGQNNQFGAFVENNDQVLHLEYFLNAIFRKRSFREGQVPILNRALQNKNVIGLLPTGGGKSLTYQLAAMLQPGVTIVVDPLRSLMVDQYQGLKESGIDSCCYINSILPRDKRLRIESKLESSEFQFALLSPERLCIYKFRERLRTMHEMGVYFAYGVIDEVHCVSEWGHDFRFTYLHLGRNLYNYVRVKQEDEHLTLFGLTATASFDVLADVERELSGNGAYPLDANTVVRYENTDRLELQYRIKKVPVNYRMNRYFDKNGRIDPSLPKAVSESKWDAYTSKSDYLEEHIQDIPYEVMELQEPDNIRRIKTRFALRQNDEDQYDEVDLSCPPLDNLFDEQETYSQGGIVFCPHRGDPDRPADKGSGISVYRNAKRLFRSIANIGTFVGSSDTEEEDELSFQNLDLFKENKQVLMVATKAFGLGIDKPNVRFTINMNYPSSLEGFVQEAGRAGRDRKMALATILVSDYRLARISPDCPIEKFPTKILGDKWFNEPDLQAIIAHYNLGISPQFIDVATPDQNWVRFECGEGFEKKPLTTKSCDPGSCPNHNDCKMKYIPYEARGWHLYSDIEETLARVKIPFRPQDLTYLNPDYEANMYFFNNNFKGEIEEKRTLHNLLSKSKASLFVGNDAEEKPTEITNNLINSVLSSEPGTELVAFLGYPDPDRENAKDEAKGEQAMIQKAIYRLCCIGFVDDFTQDYANHRFRLVMLRKPDGSYYEALKRFLMRYYANERADALVKKVPQRKGENEVQKCLGYLTEFIYSKIAVKRKRALDDIRVFCASGSEHGDDWLEANEDLKDFIYYYFNSKYANEDYVAETGEPFSLTTDTDWGKKTSTDIVLKYMRVIDDSLIGGGGTPIDNIKHLQGAVRLIRRSLTDTNPALTLLNFFCLTQLGTNNSDALDQELLHDYRQGIMEFAERMQSAESFWAFFDCFRSKVLSLPNKYDSAKLAKTTEEIMAEAHLLQLKKVSEQYLDKQGDRK